MLPKVYSVRYLPIHFKSLEYLNRNYENLRKCLLLFNILRTVGRSIFQSLFSVLLYSAITNLRSRTLKMGSQAYDLRLMYIVCRRWKT